MLHYLPTAPSAPPAMNLDGSMTCTGGQVAQLLGMSETTFKRRLATGQLSGFPRKLPGVNKWSRPAVVAWITNNGNPPAQALAIPNGDPAVEAAVSELEARYAEAS